MLTINPVINSSYYNKHKACAENKQTFTGRLPDRVFSEIRDIPKLGCAFCECDMLTNEQVKVFLKSFVASAKNALNNKALEPFVNTEAYNIVKELSGKYPGKSVHEVLSIPENTQIIKKLTPHQQLDVTRIALASDKVSVKAPKVMQKLDKYFENFSDETKQVINLMEIYSIKYPQNTFAEIFNKPEVVKYHSKLYELYINQNSLQKRNIFKQLRDLSPELSAKDIKALQNTNSNVLSILNNEYCKPHIKKLLVEDMYKNFASQSSNKDIEPKIMNIIKELPYSVSPEDKFVNDCVKNKSTDIDIISQIVKELQATWEHAKAKSNGGSNSIDNLLVLCSKCNAERANLPYPFLMRIHPNIKENVQKQINKIISYLIHGKLKGHEDYPIGIKKTMLTETNNMINLDISKYLKIREERAAKQLEKAQAALLGDEIKCNNAGAEIAEIDSKLDELMSQLRKLKKQRHIIEKHFEESTASKEVNETDVKKSSELLDKIKQLIENDKFINKIFKS
ncbi:TPA: HNH endonuclease [Candidatus Gastranaerophilales bacterium HUM_20]|nr:unknown [Clostridium sp. CAG:729]DAB24019.1 MAG TPA: HNH endonuclease [Candidatus Gastranaerophilales bacterium HUM_20]